jgi:hypothetical protein
LILQSFLDSRSDSNSNPNPETTTSSPIS